ncbi:hypothetical protein EMCRGX_G016811 [Ephydatia muelleri]
MDKHDPCTKADMNDNGQNLEREYTDQEDSVVDSTNAYNLPPPHPDDVILKGEYDSLDYDVCYNVPYKKQLKSYTAFTYWHVEAMRWILVAIIGILTGLAGFGILACMDQLVELKYEQFTRAYHYLLQRVSIVEPLAGGSGVPELICYLNGIKIPRIIQIRSVVAKFVGVIFSTAAGFYVGQEGPMFYIGAVIGSGVSQLQSFLPGLKKYPIPYSYFRCDREKRDFVSCGAAAGVAAAFGAPIGGTLFSLEEGSSFWNQSLTWRTLFCSLFATFTFNITRSWYNKYPGELGRPGLVNFGTFLDNSCSSSQELWRAQHLIIFIVMGAIGGLLGALFNSLNTQVALWRTRFLIQRKFPKVWRAVEALFIITATTLTAYLCSMFLGTCVPHVPEINPVTIDFTYLNKTQSYFCPATTDLSIPYHNDFATLLFNPGELAITQLFQLGPSAYSTMTLGIGFVVYFTLACWTLGAAIASGLFVPTILLGAIYGRLIAQLFQSYPVPYFPEIPPATFALIGSAAFLGGVMRMTISLTVILIETTQQISYGLPIMITLMVAKWVGDLFNSGIYHATIHYKNIPFLDEKAPDQLNSLLAEDVMSENISFLYPITRVESLCQLLHTTTHSAFPVVTPFTSHGRPLQNVTSKHVPALYGDDFTLSLKKAMLSCDETAPISSSLRAQKKLKFARRKRSTFKKSKYTHAIKHNPKWTAEDAPAQLYKTDRSDNEILLSKSLSVEDLKVRREDEQGPLILHGMILRSQLVQLLTKQTFFNTKEQPNNQRELNHKDMMEGYPRFKTNIDHLDINEDNRDMLMDVTLYMNPCPFTISNQAPLPQVFTLFRTMGLRHLPVVKASGVLVGIITRHDLAHDRLKAILTGKRRTGFQ